MPQPNHQLERLLKLLDVSVTAPASETGNHVASRGAVSDVALVIVAVTLVLHIVVHAQRLRVHQEGMASTDVKFTCANDKIVKVNSQRKKLL